MPGLSATARPRNEGDRGVDAVASELEAALIPVNRQAARRALARLARETSRAREMGKISAAQRAATGAVDVPAPKRAAATTLVGHAPQPAAEAPRPMLTARVEVEIEASVAPAPLDPSRVSADGFADALGVSETPSIVCTLGTFETPEPEPYVVEGPPFEPTPTAMGMQTRFEDDAPASCPPASVSAPSPEPRKPVLETAPWRALDDAAIAALGLGEGEATEIDAVAAVAPVEPSDVPTAACEPVVAPCDAVAAPIVACAAPAEASDDAPPSEGPTLELYVEDLVLPALALGAEVSRATLPFPLTIDRLEQTPSPMTEPTTPAAGSDASAVVTADPTPADASTPAEGHASSEAPVDVASVEIEVVADVPATLEPTPLPSAAALEHTPYVYELLRRAARVSAPPPSSLGRSRADELIEKFGAKSDEQSLFAAKSSLKTLIGLSPTPPPATAAFVASMMRSPIIVEAPQHGPLSTPPPAPPLVVARLARPRRTSALAPVAFFALGLLVAGAALSALRPDIVSDMAARVGRGPSHEPVAAPATAAPAADARDASPAAASRRATPRAERDTGPGRAR
jgi:hypothetical protein